MFVKQIIKSIVKKTIIGSVYKNFCEMKYVASLQRERKVNLRKASVKILRKINNGEKIKVCLFESRKQIWCFDKIYELLTKNNMLDVNIVAIPFESSGHEIMLCHMHQLTEYLTEKGIQVIQGYREDKGEYFDVKKNINPDVILFTQNWDDHTAPLFYMRRFNESYNYLISYGMHIVDNPAIFALPANILSKKEFIESPMLIKYAKKVRHDSAKNLFVTGSLKTDVYMDKNYKPSDPWKKQDIQKKRIIWAPHFSFVDNCDNPIYVVASFYEIADFMLKMAEKYKGAVQFAFKPHPLLRRQLEKHWSVEKIDAYYQKWDDMENTQYHDGDYRDLFLTSDAMIMDSISFIIEYMMTGKPSLYTVSKDAKLTWNPFGQAAYDRIYHTTYIKEDIEKFIEKIILNANDIKKNDREDFLNKNVFMGRKISSAQQVYNEIISDIFK